MDGATAPSIADPLIEAIRQPHDSGSTWRAGCYRSSDELEVRHGQQGLRLWWRWKKWLAIYVVAGVVVYLIVYLAFFYDSGGGAAGGGGGLY
jgi:hypothetical protein